jgi:hypothetical protein
LGTDLLFADKLPFAVELAAQGKQWPGEALRLCRPYTAGVVMHESSGIQAHDVA